VYNSVEWATKKHHVTYTNPFSKILDLKVPETAAEHRRQMKIFEQLESGDCTARAVRNR